MLLKKTLFFAALFTTICFSFLYANFQNVKPDLIASNSEEWNKDKSYNAGSTVIHGEFEGQEHHWYNNWWASKDDIPGVIPDSAKENPWSLINSLGFGKGEAYKWIGWNDSADMWEYKHDDSWIFTSAKVGTWGPQIESKGPGVYVPTYRDGAEGAYTVIHEDFGAMSFEGAVKPALDILSNFPRIKTGWGVLAHVMDTEEWREAQNMVKEGHEIICHSYNHQKAYDLWQWHYHGDSLNREDWNIPVELRNLCVDSGNGNWEDLTIEIPRVTYKSGDIQQPETTYTTFTYQVANYEFIMDSVYNSDWGEYEYTYPNKGKIKTNSYGWDDNAGSEGSNVSMLKLFCQTGWDAPDFHVNMKVVKDLIDENVYNQVNSDKFPKNKKCGYYVYPLNDFDHRSHDSLYNYGYIGACGGDRLGIPTNGDFYYPFGLTYDNFFQLDANGETVYPDNPHQRISLNGMPDICWKMKGYMIRKLSACVLYDIWQCNCDVTNCHHEEKSVWWGQIDHILYSKHLKLVDSLITENKITVYTPSEAVKYRLTANSVSSASINEETGSVLVTVNAEGCLEKFQDEISVIVKLKSPYTELYSKYEDGSYPRYQPRKMDNDGYAWSVSVNPYRLGGKVILSSEENAIISNKAVLSQLNVKFKKITRNNLTLRVSKGEYSLKIYNLSGTLMSENTIMSDGRMRTINFKQRLASGTYLVKLKSKNGRFVNKILIR